LKKSVKILGEQVIFALIFPVAKAFFKPFLTFERFISSRTWTLLTRPPDP
jgi:hypothetical protein